jgi:protein ImuB
MKRVASLYLPDWSIDRLRRIERRHAPPAEADGRAAFDAIGEQAAAERALHCSVPKEGGWRPGARWAKTDRAQVEAAIEALPQHQRPPQRELGRVSEAAENPFRKRGASRPPEERVAVPAPLSPQARPTNLRELSRRTEAAEHPFKPGARGWSGAEEVQAAIDALPAHQRPSFQELSRRSEVVDNPFRPLPPDEAAPSLARRAGPSTPPAASLRTGLPPLQFPGEDAPAKAGRGAALRGDAPAPAGRDRYRNEAPHGPLSIQRVAAIPPVQYPGEDVATRRAQRASQRSPQGSPQHSPQHSPRRSARDGHGGEAGYIAPPSMAQIAAPPTPLAVSLGTRMPSVQFPGEGPHPDNHGKSEPTAPTYGQGRFFQTGRTLGSVVARVCQGEEEREEEEAAGVAHVHPAEPPLVTTHKVGARVELAAVNPAARALGLTPGMALTLARAQVPGLEVRPADPQGDAADLTALAQLLARRWSPIVAISDPDGLFIDLTGVAHLHGGEARFARRLLRLLARHGVTARVAIADSAGAAWALARFGAGGPVQVIDRDAHLPPLAPLPPTALRLDAPSLELLARLGVESVGQLLAIPRAPLVRRFGQAIVTRLDQATGRLPEPFNPVVPPMQMEVAQRFAEPIATAEAIEHWLRHLMPRLTQALAEAGQGARSVELVAERVDGIPQRLRIGFARPTRDAAHMLRLVLRRIEEIEPGYGLDALVLHVRRADPLGPEPLAPALADETAPDLATLVDMIVNRIGADRLWRTIPVESDVPERSLAHAAPLTPQLDRTAALKLDDVRRLDERSADHPWHPRWPRPVRLLRRPERVEHVLAELPDMPPKRFTWRGRVHRIVRAEGPERITGEWWRRTSERQAVRDYFCVEDETGQRFWLYRRGDGVRPETGDLSWFLHGRGR